MQCEAVILITVQSGTANEELIAGSVSLEKKYSGRLINDEPLLFINILCTMNDYDSIIDNYIEIHKEALLELVGTGKRIGMYWAIHGNQTETKPEINALVAKTANLYSKGLKFAKINLSACWSAGPEADNSKAKTFRWDESVLSKFCKGLSQTITDKSQINGVMVAGYQSCVVMYDSADDPAYFKNLRANTGNTFDPALADGGVRNTFVKFGGHNTGKYEPTHPTGLDAEALAAISKHATEKARLAELTKITNKKSDERQEFKRLGTTIPQTSPVIAKQYKDLERYIMQKWVLRYSQAANQWNRVPLSEYTDNQNIREMMNVVGDSLHRDKVTAFILPG
jgi:hypothetical protein